MKQLTKNLSNESKKGRCLTETLFNELKEGTLNGLLEYVKNDDTLDMEFRRDYFTVYYRGGALLSVEELDSGQYEWRPLDNQYHEGVILKNAPEDFNSYIPEAKHLIDYYICTGGKNHLGEKEIQQLVVKENNYSPNSNDTDYFIVDMEYEESGKKDGRFDLIALRWDSTKLARQKNKVSLAIIEVKQGYKTMKSKSGLRKHQVDFESFIMRKKLEKDKRKNFDAFCDDMKMIFIQKCVLGLIEGNDRIKRMELEDKYNIEYDKKSYVDFICLLANYKSASSNFVAEIMGKGSLDKMKPFKIILSNDMGYGLFSNNIIEISSGISDTGNVYSDVEKRKQSMLFATEMEKREKGLFGIAKNFGGVWSEEKQKWYHYPYVLRNEYSLYNIYSPIRQEVINYFERNDIAWWGQDSDRYFPTGNLISSQIQCLNHLFAIRTDRDAVCAIIKNICPEIKDVLPSPIDCNEVVFENGKWLHKTSYISFEFTFDNRQLLGERSDKRGKKCTSVDAFVYAVDNANHKILIPIEWKYAESYKKTSESRAKQKSIDRYVKFANVEYSNLKGWVEEYEWDPLYEFARQEILMEQIVQNQPKGGIKNQPIEADDFVHIVVRPDENEEVIKYVEDFKKTLNNSSKLIEITPQDLLSPLEEKNMHPELIEYLKKRYWYR